MSEKISLEWIGLTLRELQAEQRSIRDQNRLISAAISEIATVLLQRIGNFEAQVDTRIDLLIRKVDDLIAILEDKA